jgi:thioredoxin-like negative regulator of GroEL
MPCAAVKPIIKECLAGVDVREVNVDKEPDHAAACGVQSIPTLVFYAASGSEVGRLAGSTTKAKVNAMLKKTQEAT